MTETQIGGLVVIKHKGKNAIHYDHWMGSVPKYASALHTRQE